MYIAAGSAPSASSSQAMMTRPSQPAASRFSQAGGISARCRSR